MDAGLDHRASAPTQPSVARRLAPLAVALTVFDGVATWGGLSSGSLAEANPLLAHLVVVVGPTATLALRVVFGVALVLALARLSTVAVRARDVRAVDAAMVGAVAVLGALSAYHVLLLALTVLGF